MADDKPLMPTEVVVEVVVLQAPPGPNKRYCTLYDVAPETAAQFNVADEVVILVVERPEGVPQLTGFGGTQPREVNNPEREAVMAAFIRDDCPAVKRFIQASSV